MYVCMHACMHVLLCVCICVSFVNLCAPSSYAHRLGCQNSTFTVLTNTQALYTLTHKHVMEPEEVFSGHKCKCQLHLFGGSSVLLQIICLKKNTHTHILAPTHTRCRGYVFQTQTQLRQARNIKERLCFVARNFQAEMQAAETTEVCIYACLYMPLFICV
jgi:hypothetical protein